MADKRPLKVFLCHIIPLWDAHADRDAVKALYARLTKDGVDAWLDKEKLLPGQDLGIGDSQGCAQDTSLKAL